MATLPERADYVLVPIDADGCEIEGATPEVVHDLRLTDLTDGLTIAQVPHGVPDDVVAKLLDEIRQATQETARRFVVLRDQRVDFYRLVRADAYDRDFGEPVS